MVYVAVMKSTTAKLEPKNNLQRGFHDIDHIISCLFLDFERWKLNAYFYRFGPSLSRKCALYLIDLLIPIISHNLSLQ